MEHQWIGFRFPARLLTSEEIEVFTPTCDKCNLPAVAVELQEPLEQDKPLSDFPSEALKFSCGHHTTLDVPREVSAKTDYEVYQRLRVQISCPRYKHRRYACNCITYNDSCLRRCDPILELLQGLATTVAAEIIEEGKKLDRSEKKAHERKEE